MKRRFLALIVLLVAFGACERDDICIDPTTPNLIIRFYNAEDRDELKAVSGIKVTLDGINDAVWEVSGDSIAIPIKVTEDITKYTLVNTIEETEITDSFTINYEREDLFIGRSCGYKTIFKNVTFSNEQKNWISSIEYTNPLNIDNETKAHIKIYH